MIGMGSRHQYEKDLHGSPIKSAKRFDGEDFSFHKTRMRQ